MITHFLAGPAAQRHYSRRANGEGADGDLKRARYYAGLIAGASQEKHDWLMRAGELRARELMRRNWPAVAAVANALERRGRLLRAEAVRILRRHKAS